MTFKGLFHPKPFYDSVILQSGLGRAHAFIHGLLHAAVPGYTLPPPLVPVPAEFSSQVPSAAVTEPPEHPSQAGDTGAHTVCPQTSQQPTGALFAQ